MEVHPDPLPSRRLLRLLERLAASPRCPGVARDLQAWMNAATPCAACPLKAWVIGVSDDLPPGPHPRRRSFPRRGRRGFPPRL